MGNGVAVEYPRNERKIVMPIADGAVVPIVAFKMRLASAGVNGGLQWSEITTEELFWGKRVVLFSVPGAFFSQSANQHLPEYEAHYDLIRSLGIDEVYCLSVHDAFGELGNGICTVGSTDSDMSMSTTTTIMTKRSGKVQLLPDSSAAFTRAIGMGCKCSCIDCASRGGIRTCTYSAVLNDMRVEKIFLEENGGTPEESADRSSLLSVADAATMIEYLQFNFFPQTRKPLLQM